MVATEGKEGPRNSLPKVPRHLEPVLTRGERFPQAMKTPFWIPVYSGIGYLIFIVDA